MTEPAHDVATHAAPQAATRAAGLRYARAVAIIWRDAAMARIESDPAWALAAHPLALVLGALDGETDPAALGVSAYDLETALDAQPAVTEAEPEANDWAAESDTLRTALVAGVAELVARAAQHAAPPVVGSAWTWEPDKPHACVDVVVTKVRHNGEEWWVESIGPDGKHWNSLSRWQEAAVPRAAQPAAQCLSCGGSHWVKDENWQPRTPSEGYKRWDGSRHPGDGLIPCGACSEGEWHHPAPQAEGVRDGERWVMTPMGRVMTGKPTVPGSTVRFEELCRRSLELFNVDWEAADAPADEVLRAHVADLREALKEQAR